MVDPTAIDDVKVPGTEFMDDYDTGGDFTPPPQPKEIVNGRPRYIQFSAQAPGEGKIKLRDENGKFLKTREGFLKAVVEEIKLVESGYVIGQTHIGTGQYKKYDNKTKQPTGELRNASPALDYLRAHGIDSKPATADEYESLFKATGDRQFLITGDWSAYDKDTQSDVASKWEEFPDEYAKDGVVCEGTVEGAVKTGRKLPFIEKNGKRFWARLQVKRYVSQVEEKK
jgi:hypothetical protein